MDKFDNAIKQAIDNLGVDYLKVTKQQIEIIKDDLMNTKENNNTIDKLIDLSIKEEKRYGKR